MTIPKFRAAIVVFLVGFLLGLSVFAASRLFVRSILAADASSAVQELANRLAEGGPVEASGGLSSILRYTQFNSEGGIVDAVELGSGDPESSVNAAEMRRTAEQAVDSGVLVIGAPLLPSLLGLTEPRVRSVAAPVIRDGQALGSVYAEVDQALALESLTRAFSLIAMVTVGLAVLAIIAIVFAVTRGRGLANARKAFDPSQLPRDPLTGLPTRDGFKAALADAVERAAVEKQVGLLLVDLNDFRIVNDLWSHAVGDEVLRATAERLGAFASGDGMLARITGNHFALIVEGDATHGLRQLAQSIRQSLSQPYDQSGRSIMIGVSIGAAVYPVNAGTADMLFRAADMALSKAMSEGRNTLAFFDTAMELDMRRRGDLERDLRAALDREEFVLFYQPQLELASGRLRGYEALLRWERPGEGIVAPSEFLPVAERTGLIHEIGAWVLKKACRDAVSWADPGTVAVNLCAAQLRHDDIARQISAALSEAGLPAERLEIEVPEGLFLHRSEEALATLARIRALGVRIAMDDFGARYSGLSTIAHFRFDKVKIDKSFVSQLTEDPDAAVIVAAIVALGRSLSVDITAEGVESSEQVTLLRAAGCNIVQGFLFGAPQRDAAAVPQPQAALEAQPMTAVTND